MYNEIFIRFGFCDIINNQGLGKCYQPRPSGQVITLPLTLIIPDITKTSSNNCLLFACFAADLFPSSFFIFLLLGSALPWYLMLFFCMLAHELCLTLYLPSTKGYTKIANTLAIAYHENLTLNLNIQNNLQNTVFYETTKTLRK